MPLVNIWPGISVHPDRVDHLVAIAKSGKFTVNIANVDRQIASVVFDTPDAAEAFVADATEKVNGEKDGTRLPGSDDRHAMAESIVDALLRSHDRYGLNSTVDPEDRASDRQNWIEIVKSKLGGEHA